MADASDLDATRLLIGLLADKWTIPVLGALCAGGGKQRFNAIRREVPSISQKSLVTCLKRLEMNGLVERNVLTRGELAVEYRMTELGHTLDEPVAALLRWSCRHGSSVRAAQDAFIDRTESAEDEWGLELPRLRAVG